MLTVEDSCLCILVNYAQMNKGMNSYLMPLTVGGLTGIIGALFQMSILYVDGLIVKGCTFLRMHHMPVIPIYIFLTIFGITMVYLLVKKVSIDASGSGIPEIEGALLHKLSIVWHRSLFVKFIGGVIAISLKMVVGREGPTVQMGGNLGHMLGKIGQLTTEKRDVLIAAGAGAGLATAFNAPIAGILFVLEELRHSFHCKFIHMLPIALCCVMATITRNMLMGSDAIISLGSFELPPLTSLWVFLVFGFAVGLLGMIFNKTMMNSLYFVDTFSPEARLIFVMMVGLLVGVSALFRPDWVGGGYDIVRQSVALSPPFLSVCILLVIRLIATILCYNTSVPGGIFSPLIALGTLFGLAFFQLFQWMMVDLPVHANWLAVVGMGGLFAASVRAPLTGIVLVIEMTQNYTLALPLMVTCFAAVLLTQIANNQPIYRQLLDRKLKNRVKHG